MILGDATPTTTSTVLDEEEFDANALASRRGSAAVITAEDEEHLKHYVENQLNRVRSSVSIGTYEDEFETKADKENGNA